MVKKGSIKTRFSGIFNCIKRMVIEEGPKVLWKGNGTHLPFYSTTLALNFAFYERFKRTIHKNNDKDGGLVWFAANIASGGLAGSVSLAFMYPLYWKMTKNGGKKQYTGFIDVSSKTNVIDGIVTSYRGFGISCLGVFIYRGLYFGLYDAAKPLLSNDWKNNFSAHFAIGWSVTVLAGLVSYPIDTIRRRMMMMTSGQAVKYSGSIDCA